LISKMNLTTKMMVFIGTVTAIALAATIIISYVLSSNMAIEEGFAKVEEMAYKCNGVRRRQRRTWCF